MTYEVVPASGMATGFDTGRTRPATQTPQGAVRMVQVGADGVLSAGRTTVSATIANGASLSAAIDLGDSRALAAIVMPASWTTANLTFQASPDGTSYFDLYDGGAERSVTASTSRVIAVTIVDWLGLRYLKIRSGTSGTPVTQGADRTLTLITVGA